MANLIYTTLVAFLVLCSTALVITTVNLIIRLFSQTFLGLEPKDTIIYAVEPKRTLQVFTVLGLYLMKAITMYKIEGQFLYFSCGDLTRFF